MRIPITPFLTERQQVSTHPHHRLHIEHYGCPTGVPVLCVHGGPGGDSGSQCILKLGLFDLEKHHIVFFDQRGCGKSVPFAECGQNSPTHTVHDMELLRKIFGWKRMVLFGGSYGTSLILLYTIAYPQRVIKYILRSVYLMGDVISIALKKAHPVLWRRLQRTTNQRTLKRIAQTVSHNIRTNHKTKKQCIRNWCALENSCLPTSLSRHPLYLRNQQCTALMESHYEANRFFLPDSYDLLKECKKMRSVRGLIVHGDADLICHVSQAKALHKVLDARRVRLVVVNGGGHSAQQKHMREALRRTVPVFMK